MSVQFVFAMLCPVDVFVDIYTLIDVNQNYMLYSSFSGLPGSGFYPEISGIFRAVGIFLGNFFWGKNLGKILGILENRLEKFFRIDLLVTKHSYENKSGIFHSHFANHHSKVVFINRSETIAKMGRKEANVKRVPKGNLVQLVKTMSKHLFK